MKLVARDGRLYVDSTNSYLDGAEYYGPDEFKAEHGITFEEFCKRQEIEDIEVEQEGRLYREA